MAAIKLRRRGIDVVIVGRLLDHLVKTMLVAG
jgi:hypothetical protein